MISTLAVENYRSLRRVVIPLGRLTVVVGANGVGKSNLYRALRLLAECSRNGAVAALAREGGLQSTFWAGPEKVRRGDKRPVQATRSGMLRLGFAGETFGYAVDLGLPPPAKSQFNLDPEIKAEAIWVGPVLRPAAVLAERHGGAVKIRERAGGWHRVRHALLPFDSMLSELADPQSAPELLALREQIRSWRFYDHVRTDAHAPARGVQVGTRTPVLGHDGADLAAALQTIREIGDHGALDEAVDRAFPGSRIEIVNEAGRFELTLHQDGLLRPLGGAELSDGTLRYLLWIAALLTPRPPELLVLNEPETSLHPDLLEPLAELVVRAAERIQIVVVTHSARLAKALDHPGLRAVELVKENGETTLRGQGLLDEPAWHWVER